MHFKTLNLMWAHAHMLGYKYAAVDKDGQCFGYKTKPECSAHSISNMWIQNDFQTDAFSHLGVFTGDFKWTKTLNE